MRGPWLLGGALCPWGWNCLSGVRGRARGSGFWEPRASHSLVPEPDILRGYLEEGQGRDKTGSTSKLKRGAQRLPC